VCAVNICSKNTLEWGAIISSQFWHSYDANVKSQPQYIRLSWFFDCGIEQMFLYRSCDFHEKTTRFDWTVTVTKRPTSQFSPFSSLPNCIAAAKMHGNVEKRHFRSWICVYFQSKSTSFDSSHRALSNDMLFFLVPIRLHWLLCDFLDQSAWCN